MELAPTPQAVLITVIIYSLVHLMCCVENVSHLHSLHNIVMFILHIAAFKLFGIK